MEIVIGAISRVGPPGPKTAEMRAGTVEAKLLNVRQPRRRQGRPPTGQADRRGGKTSPDPSSGRVVVLLIPEGYSLPKDIDEDNYRILLRFVPRKK